MWNSEEEEEEEKRDQYIERFSSSTPVCWQPGTILDKGRKNKKNALHFNQDNVYETERESFRKRRKKKPGK